MCGRRAWWGPKQVCVARFGEEGDARAKLVVLRGDELVGGCHAHGEWAGDVWDGGGDVREVVEVVVAGLGGFLLERVKLAIFAFEVFLVEVERLAVLAGLVGATMLGKVVGAGEGFVAQGAHVWPLLSMRTHVPLKML